MKNKRKVESQNKNRVTGAIILALIIFMVFIQRTNLEWVKNWWAFLFLIPAIASINTVLSEIQNKKGFSFSLASNIVGIIFPIAICIIFLFSLGWNTSFPIIILLSGLSMLMLGFVRDSKGSGTIIRALRPWFFSWGFAVILVGVITFIDNGNFGLQNQTMLRWFGYSLLIAAGGGFISAWISFRKNSKADLITIAHLVVAFIIALPGILAVVG
ncbi:MAG: hypothetical protein Q7U53_12925 [Anaerolineaceae bacterium]|nr:hypothetical protein [Anaerolineaceae bacterium]